VFANGEMVYKVKGVCARVSVAWNYQAPEGAGDTHYSVMKGSKAQLVIRQGAEQNFKPVLYIEPVHMGSGQFNAEDMQNAFEKIGAKYPGIKLKRLDGKWEVQIPDKYRIGHEAHFAQVTQKFLQYLVDGKLPDWEVPNMIAKYYTTTKALEISMNN
jgi:hypothetical protein